MQISSIVDVIKSTAYYWSTDRVSRLSAAISYYTIFSLAPLLIICIAIAGFVFGADVVKQQLLYQIAQLIGNDSAITINTMLENAKKPASGFIPSLIGVITLFFGVLGLFAELQDCFDNIWEVQPKPDRSYLQILKERFVSFVLILSIGILLLVSLLLSAFLGAGGHFYRLGNSPTAEWLMVDFIISTTLITFLFALVFKILPDVVLKWTDVWLGAIVTALLFSSGKFLIGMYLGKSNIVSVYGTASSLIVILVWVYYSSQILLIGAELTKVYTRKFGSHSKASNFVTKYSHN